MGKRSCGASRCYLGIFLVAMFPAGAVGQEAAPTLRIPHVSRPPTLQDFLTNTPREAEARVTEFRQRDPGDGLPASQPATAYLSYDDEHLYVVFVCRDDSSAVRAHLSKREQVFGDDLVGVALDTFRDRQHAYFFGANPLGVQIDGIITEGQNDDFDFDTLWAREGQRTADGYVVWIAVPFKSLRFADAAQQTWGIALFRQISRTNEQVWWPYITRRIESFVPQLAQLDGLEHVASGRNVHFIPYGEFAGARFLDEQTASIKRTAEPRVGVDGKIVVRDALTLDLTINPDFSQVESDEPQVTVNQRFEVFFPEKRPFFLENAGFFQTPETLLFSRRIADPEFGARLSGKMGHWLVGGLVMDDRAAGARLSPPAQARAGVGVLRIQRELRRQSTVGVFLSDTDVAGRTDRVGAIDTRLKLGRNWVLTGQASASARRLPNGSRESGTALKARIQQPGRHLYYETVYTDRSPNFSTSVGFIPRTDIRDLVTYLQYNWRPVDSRVQAFGPFQQLGVNWNRRGQIQDWLSESAFSFNFPRSTSFQIGRVEKYELFQNLPFRSGYLQANCSTQWLDWLSVNGSYYSGTGVNYAPARALDPFATSSQGGSLTVTLRPSSGLRWDGTYLFAALTDEARGSVFSNHLVRSKVNYQFTREWSLRAIVDYNGVLPNATLVALDRTKRLTADVLLTRQLNPWTAIYIGYTDRYANLDMSPVTPSALARLSGPTNSVGRQVFVKTSYLLRF